MSLLKLVNVISTRAPYGSIKNLLQFIIVRTLVSFKVDDANFSLYEYIYQVNDILIQKAPCGNFVLQDIYRISV